MMAHVMYYGGLSQRLLNVLLSFIDLSEFRFFISRIFILPQKGEQIFGYRQKGVTFEQSLHILLNDSEWMLDAILDSKFWIFILFLSQEYTGPMLLAFY